MAMLYLQLPAPTENSRRTTVKRRAEAPAGFALVYYDFVHRWPRS
jgi:hypothetical protein